MEIDNDITSLDSMECHKILDKTFLPLRILRYTHDNVSLFLLWNKFTILIRQTSNLTANRIAYSPEFLIKRVFVIRNIFLCMDEELYLHFTVLRKKGDETETPGKLDFKTIARNVLAVHHRNEEIYVWIKKETNTMLYVYSIIGTSKMKVTKIYTINMSFNDSRSLLFDTSLEIEIKPFKSFSLDFIAGVFGVEISKEILESNLLLIAKENTLYWTVMEENTNQHLNLSILISCPVPVKAIHFIKDNDSRIFLSLKTGSILVIFCDAIDRCLASEIIHLNSSIERIIVINESVLYTDGEKLWHTIINPCSDNFSLEHKLLHISYPYDFFFAEESNKVYCINLQNIIYTVDIECGKLADNSAIPVPDSLTDFKKLITAINVETKKNETILHSVIEEESYLTVLFLNRNKNLILEHACSIVKIYDISSLENDSDIILLEKTQKYCEKDVHIYIMELKISKSFKEKMLNMNKRNNKLWHLDFQLKFNDIYDSYNASLSINKNTHFRIALPLLKKRCSSFVSLEAKLVALVPEVYDKNNYFWCLLPLDSISIDSLYYLEPLSERKNNLCIEAKVVTELNKKIAELAVKNSGLIYEIEEQGEKKLEVFSYYVKLPHSLKKYSENFANMLLTKIITARADSIKDEICSSHFIDSEKIVRICVSGNFLDISIEKMEDFDKMIISSDCVNTCWDVFKFVLNILRTLNSESNLKSVPHFDYMILKDLQENIDAIINLNNGPTKEVLMHLSDGFYKDVIGILPL